MSLETYYHRLHVFQTFNTNNKVFIEVEKCCGYGEFVCVFKKDTLVEVSNMISKTFDYQVKRLYIKDQNGNVLDFPLTSEETLRDFIGRNALFFRPVYPIPAIVVYKIYYEDDLKHDCCNNNNNKNT